MTTAVHALARQRDLKVGKRVDAKFLDSVVIRQSGSPHGMLSAAALPGSSLFTEQNRKRSRSDFESPEATDQINISPAHQSKSGR